MLSNLKIENIAIIESASIDFENNFNCLTGETGAGKSIIIDSINAILGEKTSRDLIRTGENKAFVSAFFTDISRATIDVLKELDIPCEEDLSLLISRTLSRDGKNICKVNGATVTVSMLKRIGLSLINIHGQSDNQQLLSPELHYQYIDSVADNENLISAYSELYHKYCDIKSQIAKLSTDDEYKARKIDLLEYQINELKMADIKIGEREALTKRRDIIANSQKLSEALNNAHMALNGNDEFGGAVSLLFDAAKSLSVASEFLNEADDIYNSINDMAYTVEALSSDINSLIDETEFNDYELAEIEERLDLLYSLSKKYGDSEEKMLNFLDKAENELHNITYSDEIIERLKNELKVIKKDMDKAAKELSDSRRAAAVKFSKSIIDELEFLDMKGTLFSVEFKEVEYTENGIDQIQFLISANKGEEPKPLYKIASGGELSRIMLAIKSVLAEKDETDTLIFDEIDTGVSGRAAGKIAIKISDVSKLRQVICITHLPAIAAFADNHMLISKEVIDEKTYTKVIKLSEDGRISEIARIIGGNEKDSIHLRSAGQLISDANEYKLSNK